MKYQGSELTLFQHARNWKNYWISLVRHHLTDPVLEVGAGIGANTILMAGGREWLALEPDPELHRALATDESLRSLEIEALSGTLHDLDTSRKFNTILYLDVLEHIEDDRKEIDTAIEHLHPGGRLIILAPALPLLYSKFDETIGHYRRYTKESLTDLLPKSTSTPEIFYLDSLGLLLSLANRLLLRQSYPTVKQILFWDRFVIPPTRLADHLLARSIGRTVVSIWTKPDD